MSDYKLKPDSESTYSDLGKYLTSFQRQLLRKNLQENLPQSYRQRIEIMLLTDQGKTQTEICQILGCCAATARHWIHIARSGMAHQWRDFPIGRPKTVNEEYLERLQELVSDSPRNYGYSFRRWTVNWLQKHLAKEFGVEISDRHIKRLLKQMDLSTLPKASNNQETTNNANNSKILIRDLKTDLPESAEPFNLPKLSIDSDIHGARHIQGIICATVQQYFGLFSFNSRISAHS